MDLLHLRSEDLEIFQSPEGQERPHGLHFGRDGFNGWDDGATMRSETVARPQAIGDFDMPGYLAGRLVPMEGWALADSPKELERLRDRFIGHGADGGKFQVAVKRNGRTLHAAGRLAAGTVPTFKDVGTGRRARWATTWWFPDPRKYGEPNNIGPASSLRLVHGGNFRALPQLHITGASGGGYTIGGPGGRLIVVTRPLVGGVAHRFDMTTGRLYVGGVRVIGGVARADLWSIPPGVEGATATISAGLLRAEYRDTFN